MTNEAAERERERADRLVATLTQINDIRNSIIGHQNGNWSLHIYPLVAALNAAGFPGLKYEEAKANLDAIDARCRAILDAEAER